MDFCEIVPVVTKETFLSDLNMILILSSGDTSLQHTNQNDSKIQGLVCKPGKLQWGKQRKQHFAGGLTALHNLLFCAHALCHDYLTETFLLVSCQQFIPIVICARSRLNRESKNTPFTPLKGHVATCFSREKRESVISVRHEILSKM